MKILTATEISRNFSRVLDELKHEGEEIVIMRGKRPVARMVPGAPHLNALDALADLYCRCRGTDLAQRRGRC